VNKCVLNYRVIFMISSCKKCLNQSANITNLNMKAKITLSIYHKATVYHITNYKDIPKVAL